MERIVQCVEAVRQRQQREWLWKCASVGMAIGGLLTVIAGTIRLLTAGSFSEGWLILMLLAGPVCGVVTALLRRCTPRQAAVSVDLQYQLKDRTETALGFLNSRSIDNPLTHLQIADASTHLQKVDPAVVVPIHGPRSWPAALTLTALGILLILISGPPEQLSAADEINQTVFNQAARAEQELEDLKAFQQEQNSPELEQLLKELAETIEQLKQPGVDPKEALAKLSEMESALQIMQQQLQDPATDAQLQEVGQVLALADPMAAAGQAMARGDLEKAAEELSQLEMPDLDRRTQKAITEKLDQQQQNSSADGAQRKQQLSQALAEISQGLSQGDRSRFKDGMNGLAGECRRQAQRKKLSDLLRKQCQSLSECKSECEIECRNQAESNRKGGNKAGTAQSGNQPGDKTPMLKTTPQMNITGQDSGQGEVDVETSSAPEQEQEALRQYRDAAARYEALSESVLESESIPLGHRQTIRRYFELIRPQAAELDAVLEKTDRQQQAASSKP